ncbi:MAG TPA: hypothetical protein VKU00_08850 [Chthonomonadaceae bacterium]|nr:hypothetical protein [Chthonomonadaceae bacterium]
MASPTERAAYDSVFQEFSDKHMGTGNVHVYLLKPDGHALSGLDIGSAMDTNKMIQALKDAAATLKTPQGPPVIAPTRLSVRPKTAPDALALHLVARGTGHGSWREFPSENWIVFAPEEYRSFLPPGKAATGTTWSVRRETAEKLLRYFYPQTEQTEDSKVLKNRIDHLELNATVVSVQKGVAHVRLEGSLRMHHQFYPGKPDNNMVDATVVGYLDFEPGKSQIRSFQMTTDKATYANEDFGVGVCSVAPTS